MGNLKNNTHSPPAICIGTFSSCKYLQLWVTQPESVSRPCASIFLYLLVAVATEPEPMESPRGKDREYSLPSKRTGVILCGDNKCWPLLVLWPWIWWPFSSFHGQLSACLSFSSSSLVANLFWLRIYLSPHVDISSYCIKKNTGESKQASIFQQVTEQRSPTQISKKRRRLGVEDGEQIYL